MSFNEFFENSKEYYENKLDEKYPGLKEVMEKKVPVVIYGAGRMGRFFREQLHSQQIQVLAFADANKELYGTSIDSTEVIPPEDLKTGFADTPILVASLLHETAICEKLKKLNLKYAYPLFYLNLKYPDIFVCPEYKGEFDSLFNASNQGKIREVMKLWNDEFSRMVFNYLIEFRVKFEKNLLETAKSKSPQYFEPDIFCLADDEVMLDCGAYIGDTLQEFDKLTSGRFKKIYSFEPDRHNFIELSKLVAELSPEKIVPVNCGVHSTSGNLYFSETGNVDTRVTNSEKGTKLPVVSIDEFMKGKEPPTFIKMDIEGGEVDALEGSRNTISKHKPKLAIAVYHKAEDLWNIPLLIQQMNPEYKIYLRHYTNELIDTVCYAV